MDKYHNKYRVKSTRLEGWDYSSAGDYFITICVKDRINYFGRGAGGVVELSDIGMVAEECWRSIPAHFPYVELDEFVVMPNHVHGILAITRDNCRDAINRVSTINVNSKCGGITGTHNPMNMDSLSRIIRWCKGRTAFEIHKLRSGNFFQWQPGFYEHIIRNDAELNRIRQYIVENPLKWESDSENPAVINPINSARDTENISCQK